MTHTVFIDIPSEAALAATTGTTLPTVVMKLRRVENIAFAFMTAGVVAAVSGWVSGTVVIKEYPDDSAFLLDTSLAVTGATTTTRYTAAWASADCDSDPLRAFLGNATLSKECFCEIQWTDAAGTHSVTFAIRFAPTFLDPTDVAPDPLVPASETWLSARAVRFDAAQTLTGGQKVQALANIGITNIKTITKTAGGFMEVVDTDGNTFHWGLTGGSAPA